MAAMYIVKGDQVHLHKVGTKEGQLIALPDKYFMVHDPLGEEERTCDVFVHPPVKGTYAEEGLDSGLVRQAKDYYGRGHRPRYARLDLSGRRWNRLYSVDRIEYRRPGEYADAYFHPYEVPVTLFRSGRVYRLALPDGCVLDSHGFVKP
jgi:hypothetical protein